MNKIPLRKESIIYILSLGLITLIFYLILPFLTITPFVIPLFVIYFFRDFLKIIYKKHTDLR